MLEATPLPTAPQPRPKLKHFLGAKKVGVGQLFAKYLKNFVRFVFIIILPERFVENFFQGGDGAPRLLPQLQLSE